MKTKSLLFAFVFCALMLGGCAATVGVGPDYGYYPPARPYYYPPRRVVVAPVPYYRQPYRSHYDGYRHEGNGYRRQGSYDGGNYGHSRRRGD